LTKKGVSDVVTDKPIEVVFLILSPEEAPDAQVNLLGITSRAAQNRHLMQALQSVLSREDALKIIKDWEKPEAQA
jgi:two-component system sensor histidine kinase KdpD